MTFWDTVMALGRRWYVVVISLACALAGINAIRSQPAVYYSRATVYFLAPESRVNPNVLQTRLQSIIITAGVVGKRLNGTETLTKISRTESVSIVDRGISDAAVIQIPDHGGQWSVSYDTQGLDVQVSGASPEIVLERQTAAFAMVADLLKDIQDDAKVPIVDRITTRVGPATPPIVALRGQPKRAMAMVAGLSFVAMMGAVALLELRRRRKLSPQALPAVGSEQAG